MNMQRHNRLSQSVKYLGSFLLAALVATGMPARGAAQTAQEPGASSNQVQTPSRTYRLIYTLTEMDGGKKLGVQHYSLTTNSRDAPPSELNVGSKVPVITSTNSTMPQFTYVDIGLHIQASVKEVVGNGLQVLSDVDQSSVSESPDQKVTQPVIRNTKLRDTALLMPGRPVVLGSFDVPGSTRHYDVEVVLEAVR